MDVLVLGGSVFLGRAMVDEALALGADVTVFNRGVSGPPPPDGVEQVVGDRTDADDLARLRGRNFDLVIDTSGYVPVDVRASADLLAPTAGFYAFVSSINAFPGWPEQADYAAAGTHDGDPDATRDDVPPGMDDGDAYGWLKVGCERAVERAFGPDRCSLLRGGSIVGPHDSAIGRLPWWIARVAAGGEVLVPGGPDDTVSLIDSRDLAQFALAAVPGTYEVAGPSHRDTRSDLMAACRTVTGSDAAFTYVDGEWLHEQGVGPWVELPLWVPLSVGPSVFTHNTSAAAQAGLRWRPLAETVADTWAWQQTGVEPNPKLGLAADRERALLAAWRAR